MKNFNFEITQPGKKHIDLDLFYEGWKDRIEKNSLIGVEEIRKYFKEEFEKLDVVLKNHNLSIGMRRFLKRKRLMVRNILAAIKQKIKSINMIVHNTSSKEVSRVFMEVASKELSKDIFQKILSKAVDNIEAFKNGN